MSLGSDTSTFRALVPPIPFPTDFPIRVVLDRLPAGAYTCDAEGLITYYNRNAVELWGRVPRLRDPVDRFCGSFKLLATDGTPLGHERCWMALALESEGAYEGQEIIVERPDGERRVALAHATPFHDESGRLIGAVNVLVDVTELKAAQRAAKRSAENLQRLNESLEILVQERTKALENANQVLEERNRDLEQFANVASHDLQEPLRTVTSFVQLLERSYGEQLDEHARSYIAHAVGGALRMHELVQDLLVYSRIGASDEPFEVVDVRAVVETLLRDLAEGITEAGAIVTVGELPRVNGDRTQIRQLFQNLVANAIKFRRSGTPPRIEIRAEPLLGEDREGWTFTVSDDGIGIDMDHADRLFQMFQRLHARGEYKGTGIGLAVCKRIVERHGGRILVDSVPGRGTVFTFTLPGAGS